MMDEYFVGLHEKARLIATFPTEEEATKFIETLPGYLDGRYYLDGPERDA